jgi:hypothetical protein
VPYPSTLQAVWEYRHRDLLTEAVGERLAIKAVQPRGGREGSMFEQNRDAMIQRGIDEALACQDMLLPAPFPPSRRTRMIGFIAKLRQGFDRLPAGRWRSSSVIRQRVLSRESHGQRAS